MDKNSNKAKKVAHDMKILSCSTYIQKKIHEHRSHASFLLVEKKSRKKVDPAKKRKT